MSANVNCGRGFGAAAFVKRTTLLLLVIWSLFVAGCSDDGGGDTPPVGPDATMDAKKDSTPAVDSQPDVGPDRGVVTPEGGSDADSGTTTPDSGDGGAKDGDATTTPEATPDATPDRGPDATPDATPDRGPDVTPDATPDRGPDAVPDVVIPDASPDVAPPVTLGSIEVTPANKTTPTVTTVQYQAIGHYSNSTTQDLTATATWTSSVQGVATIVAGGLATAGSTTGLTSISASFGGITGSTNLTVAPTQLVSIAIEPVNPTIAPATTVSFKATGTYDNGSTQNITAQVAWASASPQFGTIDATTGVATGIMSGPTVITATQGTIVGQTLLTVQAVNIISIAVTPGSPTVPRGIHQQFKAVATFDDASTQDITQTAVWESDTPGTALVGSTGLATSVNPGTTVISATKGGRTGLATLTVTSARLDQIVVTPGNASIADGTTVTFKADGIYSDNTTQDLTIVAAWISSDTAVATIANGPEDGKATAIDPGDVAISATYLGVTGSALLHVTQAVLKEIQVTPPTALIANGTTKQFTATGIYTDNHSQDITTQVSWSSDAPTVATVDANGLATGKAVGTGVVIKATQGMISGIANLDVSDAALVSIAITPAVPAPSIPDGLTVQFTAIGTYTDATTQDLTQSPTIVWASTSNAVATINAVGLASADSLGTTTITAAQSGKTSNAVVLTVTDAVLQSITVTPATATTPDGLTVPFAAAGHYSDGSTVTLTTLVAWTSGTPATATINPTTGLAQAVDPGTSIIKAALGGISGTATLTVTDAVLSTITVAPATPCIASASTQQFIATGKFTDNSTVNLTNVALWASSAVGVASISNASPTFGVATAATIDAGTSSTTISATYTPPGGSAVSGSTTLFVGVCPPAP